MTYQEFKNKWIGKPINYDNFAGAQCMDVYRMYVKEVLGCPQSPPVTEAKDVWNTYLPEFFARIPNTTTGVPMQGDIVIWGMSPYGHIAICDHASTSTLTCFEQNWKELDGSGVTELRLHGNYNSVLGWLHFKETMTEEERILEFIRTNKITEGQIRQGYGYITDNVDKKLSDLEKLAYDNLEKLKAMTEKYEQERRTAVGWQNSALIANADLKRIKTELLQATNLTAWDHIKLGIELLIKQSK